MSRQILILPVPCLLVILLLVVPLGAFGDEEDTAEQEEKIDGPSRWKGYLREHFEVHGYLSTAFVSVRNGQGEDQPRSSDQFQQGLAEGDTFDYRVAALNVGYAPAPRHAFTLQLAHRHFADSPVTAAEGNLRLDWFFYRFQIRENLDLTLGRFPVANGLYNKIRDAGVLLPTFRLPYNFYREGSLVSETVDGVSLTYDHRWRSGWGLEAEGYFGRHDLVDTGGANPASLVVEVGVDPDIGFQLWIDPPLSGWRLGLGAQRFRLDERSLFNDQPADWETWFASLEYQRKRLTALAEYRQLRFPIDNGRLAGNFGWVDLSYLQIGYAVTPRWSVWGIQEFGQARQAGRQLIGSPISFKSRDDSILAVVFALSRHLRWKAEFHWESAELADLEVVSTDPLLIDPGLEEFQTRYTILSISASF